MAPASLDGVTLDGPAGDLTGRPLPIDHSASGGAGLSLRTGASLRNGSQPM
jgi:hypothetical protein